MTTIQPRLPAGFRDYNVSDMLARQSMLDTIRSTYERFGFGPLDTPAIEFLDTLLGEEADNKIFEARVLTGHRPAMTDEQRARKIEFNQEVPQRLALRFDLTVPLARYVAANWSTLPRPFKRYQQGIVYRGEKPQHGRYNGFMQFDIDTVGSDSMLADAEIVWAMHDAMTALGVQRFLIKINTRKILNGLAGVCGFDDAITTDVLRALDKIERDGVQAVMAFLAKSTDPVDLSGVHGDDDDLRAMGPGLGLPEATVERINEFVRITSNDTASLLAELRRFAGNNELMNEGADELDEIAETLAVAGVNEGRWTVDLSIARGLGYYTGPVFETTLLDLPEIGSVFSGGRFDGLVARFQEHSVPATGASIGVDRLFTALQQLKMIEQRQTATQVMVTMMEPGRKSAYIGMVSELRSAGINTAMYMGTDAAFKAQMAQAVSLEIPIIVICGSNEFADNTVTVKDMRIRKQWTVPRNELVAVTKGALDTPR